jgi:hypothetical protein
MTTASSTQVSYQNFEIGTRVRSWDFRRVDEPKIPGRPDCFVEGTVIAIIEQHGVNFYEIRAERRVWSGEEEAPEDGEIIRTPLNGTQSFRRCTNNVEKI